MECEHGFRIFAGIHSKLAFELFHKMIGQSLTPIKTSQHDVTVCCQNSEAGWSVPHDGYVERSAPKVINKNGFLFCLDVRSTELTLAPGVGQRGRSRFVDDIDDIQASDSTGVLSRFAAHVVKVIRNRDHRIGDRPDDFFCILLHLLQNQR